MHHRRQKAQDMLQRMLGSKAEFRSGQWEAIETVVFHRKKVLVVQRTGWGKSMVYFLATRLLRDLGEGPTVIISPLLSLIRNQIEMTERIGLRAMTINSSNQDEWIAVEDALRHNKCDILFISPERLNNPRFYQNILSEIAGRIGMFVVDEAHCISDWGHDFRPDYRRIVRILQILPKGIPVLGTTATANNRVIEDIHSQLGSDLLVLRGSLERRSLRLQNISLANQSQRLAWLAENLPRFKGSGVIYCLTIHDTERVAAWLQKKGFQAEAYHAGNEMKQERTALEQAFLNNQVKILVATVALGMGFDKPDIQFVIHFQRPGSVVAYYQQVGRAGRALDSAYGILLSGSEDDEIHDYFIDSAFPSLQIMNDILRLLEDHERLGMTEILSHINISVSATEKALKLLEIDGAVGVEYDGKKYYFRTPNPWEPDGERISRVLNLRRTEHEQMRDYMSYSGCLMEFLLKALDDPDPHPCGRCANCCRQGFPNFVSHQLVREAEVFLKGTVILIEPRKRWPAGLFVDQKRTIPLELQNNPGRSLCYYGDAGWGNLVRCGKYQDGQFCDDLVDASVELIQKTWKPEPSPEWVTCIPSTRHPALVPSLTQRIAGKLGLPFYPVLKCSRMAPEQKTMQNSTMQARNVLGTLEIRGNIPSGPVLLVDDILDSGWTLTMAGYLLRSSGSGIVHPYTLAKATGKGSQ